MINPGDTLFNHVTGEEVTFFETAASTGGEYVEVMCTVRPGGFVAAAHIHPSQAETFTVVEGPLDLRGGGDRLRPQPGERPTRRAGATACGSSRARARPSRRARRTGSGTTVPRPPCSAASCGRRCSSSR